MLTRAHLDDVDAAGLAMALEHGGGREELGHGLGKDLVDVLARLPDRVGRSFKDLGVRHGLLLQHGSFECLEHQNGDGLDVLRKSHVAHRLALGGPDGLSGFAHCSSSVHPHIKVCA